MREMRLVFAREFNERVRTRSYAIGTLLLPLFVLAIILLPGAGGGGARNIVLVNEATASVGQMFMVALNQPPPGLEAAQQYSIELLRGPADSVRPELLARLEALEFDAYVIIPADVRETGTIEFRSARQADPTTLRDVQRAASQAVQVDRLASAGVPLERFGELLEPVAVHDGDPAHVSQPPDTGYAGFYFAYIVAIVTYLMIALYGSGVTRSVLEEKSNRIAEVLISSMSPTDLMAGKILGVAAAVMLQVTIWVGSLFVLVTQADAVAQQFTMIPAALATISTYPGATALLLGYFLLGFLLFAALFAALGAAVTSDQEAQSVQMLFMLPLFVPLIFFMQLTTRPFDTLPRTLALLPFTSPVAMPIRMAAVHVPTGEVLLSLGLLVVALLLAVWVTAKIYRFGLLFTGRRPSGRELLRWIRAG